MVKSMTGYGRASSIIGSKKVTIEIKSLNSKGLDLNVRIPSLYRPKEMAIRTTMANELVRGKCEISLSYEILEGQQSQVLNTALLESYLKDLKAFSTASNLSADTDYLSILMKMPEALKTNKEEILEEEWEQTFKLLADATAKYQEFRIEEGNSLFNDLEGRIKSIENLLTAVPQYENERIDIVKARIQKNLQDIIDVKKIDQNRFEQELIYYLEKYDISEEKVRLKAHLEHFIKTMNEGEVLGKKLGFISQEIGREINTLGSKANHVEMQKIVVDMKEELERIKEQVLNVL